MEIIYFKTIRGTSELKPFVSQGERFESGGIYSGFHILKNYDLKGFKKNLVDDIEKSLKEKDFVITRNNDNELWVSEPNKFSLNLNAIVTNSGCRTPNKSERMFLCVKDYEKTGIKTIKGGRFRREEKIPVYEEIPSVDIGGRVQYADFKENNPVSVLNVLISLGYQSKVISLPQEVKEIPKGLEKSIKDIASKLPLIGAKEVLIDPY